MELGPGIGEPKADEEKVQLQYYLEALSAPMYDAKNVSIGEEHVNLIPGRVYSIGRSKSSCNIIFHDSRVSRQHCQVYVDPHGKHVYLIDGLVSEIRQLKPEVLKNAAHQAREGSKCQGVSSSLSSRKGEEVCRRVAEARHEDSLNSGQGLPKRAKSSLNGIYVNGCHLSQVCTVLCPGDIVSLVAPTKGTKTIDPSFGAAVGFFVHGRQQVGGLKTYKSLPSPLANHPGANEAKLRHAISDGDKQEKTTHFPSQVICDMQEMPPHAQLNTISKAFSTEGMDKHEGAADHHPRDMSKISSNGRASSLDTQLADAALLSSRNLSIKPQEIKKITLPKSKPIEKKRENNRGQKRHHVESLTDIEDKGEERFTSIEAGAQNVDDVLEDAPEYLLERQECNLVDEGKGKDGKGDGIVHSFLGRGANLAPVDMHRAILMEEHDKDAVLLPSLEQESYLKATHGLAAGMYESEKMGLRNTVRNSLAEACVIPTQLYTNPLSKDASIVKLAVFDICSPLLDHRVGYIDEPVLPAPTSCMEYLKSDTISRSNLAEPEYDQLSAEVSHSVNLRVSLATRKHEIEPPLPHTTAGFSESKDRVRSTAEILKLISKGAVKKDLEKPPLYFKDSGASASTSNVKFDDESVPQTPEDDIVESLNQEVDGIVLGSPTLQTVGPSQTHRNHEEAVNINPERKVLKTQKNMGSTGLDRNLELEEEDELQWTRLLSLDGPGLRGFCLNRLQRFPGSQGTEGDISLQQLFAPLDEVVEVFAATFTSNILWFLNSNHFSPELPVTIACHDGERSWSTCPEDRTSSPYEGWPNLTVVYPSFPDALAFTSKSKEGFRRGIGCHHPKLFLVRFYNRLRVVITSANLNQRQWLRCTNTVWWKDFPQLQAPNYKALFQPSKSKSSSLFHTTGDFGAQLAYFISRLLADVPAQAHWIVDLAKYDFSSAEASLVISIPGIHGIPYPALSRAFLNDIQKGSNFSMKPGIITPSKFLGVVSTTVVGISFRFAASADPKGFRIRSLAKLLNGTDKDEDGMLTVFLKRSKNIITDINAVSVVVSPCPRSSTAQAFLQDARQESNSSSPSQDGCVQLGFLPRDTAKWVAPLCDGGVCTLLARIWPKEALTIASGLSEGFVRLALHVFEGSRFGELCISPPTSEQAIAVGQLLGALQYSVGLHRLEQMQKNVVFPHQVALPMSEWIGLERYRWPNSVETDFVFGSSSVGTSLDAPFLAAFSAAAGRRATAFSASEESDSQWGRWTANHEAEDPSVGVVFPTLERAKASTEGPLSHLGVLCFAQKAWERLKSAKILHDAVPYPPTRDGIPMHSKVAMRRFQYSPHGTSFGWVYCGSHNFSPAAWGRPLPKCPASVAPVLGTPLLISNYELGLLFVDPPPVHAYALDDFSPEELAYVAVSDELKKDCELENGEAGAPLVQRMAGLDRFKLPFVMPPPKYKASDQPATGKALYEILLALQSECKSVEEAAELEDRLVGNADDESDESEPDEDIIPTTIGAEASGGFVGETAPANMEQQYAEALWSQIDQF